MKIYNQFTTAFLLLLAINVAAQQGINYKALIKDSSGNVVANQTITVQFQILQGVGLTNVYQETHNYTTDDNGLVILNIGEGTIDSGIFADINWEISGNTYLNVQINTGGGLTDLGTTQFMTVPFAKHAQTAANAATRINDLSDGRTISSSLYLGYEAGLDDDGRNLGNVGIGERALQNISGDYNTATGYFALFSNVSGSHNTATGFQALENNTQGNGNTATGSYALQKNTEGYDNTALGVFALINNISGDDNTAIGYRALNFNETGSDNTAIGSSALYSNTQSGNTATGYESLYSNTIGVGNAALGYQSLYSNVNGNNNTGIGYNALYENIDGQQNTAVGGSALNGNLSGDMNTAVGFTALLTNTTGYDNTAVGRGALLSNEVGFNNTAIGKSALYNQTGNDNTALGQKALSDLTSGDNNIGIGYDAQVPNAAGIGQIRMGNTEINSACIQVPWDCTSDRRWKEKIRDLPYGLDLIRQLRPVDYVRQNNEHQTREIGFIGQEVEVLLKSLGYHDQGLLKKDDEGFISLRYNDFIALLTKAMQEQHEIITSLQATVTNQQSEIKSLTQELAENKTNDSGQDNIIEKLLKRVEQLESVSNQ